MKEFFEGLIKLLEYTTSDFWTYVAVLIFLLIITRVGGRFASVVSAAGGEMFKKIISRYREKIIRAGNKK